MKQVQTETQRSAIYNPQTLASSGFYPTNNHPHDDNSGKFSPRNGPQKAPSARGVNLQPRDTTAKRWDNGEDDAGTPAISPFSNRVPVEKLRGIWNDDEVTYTDCELLTLRDWLYTMAEIMNEVINSPGFRPPGGLEKENQHGGRAVTESPRVRKSDNATNNRHPSEPPV